MSMTPQKIAAQISIAGIIGVAVGYGAGWLVDSLAKERITVTERDVDLAIGPAASDRTIADVGPASGPATAPEMDDAEYDALGGPGARSGMSPLSVLLLSEYDPSMLPTEEGLIDLTIARWNQEEFLSMTQDEARDYLALDDSVGFRGPGSFLDLLGPLPTEDDCRRGFRDQRVRDALQEVCAYEILLVELGEVPSARRGRWTAERIESAIRARDEAMEDLMRALKDATGYGLWQAWSMLYSRWSQ